MNERRGARDYFPLIYNVLKGIVGVDVRRTPASLSHTGLGSWGSLLRGGRGGGRLDHPHPGVELEVVWGALRHLGGFLHVPGLAQFRILRLALGVRLGPALFLSQPWGTVRTLQAWGTILCDRRDARKSYCGALWIPFSGYSALNMGRK